MTEAHPAIYPAEMAGFGHLSHAKQESDTIPDKNVGIRERTKG
jgi:hypothetical protein